MHTGPPPARRNPGRSAGNRWASGVATALAAGASSRRQATTTSPAVFPSKTPQPAPRVVHRAAVGRSSDLRARGEERMGRSEERVEATDPAFSRFPFPSTRCCLSLPVASQGPLASQCNDGFVPTYRCGAVLEWPCGVTSFPFHLRTAWAGENRRPQDNGLSLQPQHQIL